jgi:hypothetical protein
LWGGSILEEKESFKIRLNLLGSVR